ncbi:hypothetical protein BBC27_01835 [Acidithiobacillus ferrivorans]|uniref:Uncharacterized protein n=1 Tax=Acidithiobacillus ferrivorans TaxID=160808 RepID=A0A1B9BVU3_9PROT|nr:hypothetical protein BBC27_01835 [Acidithiobacillus ferrivorans]
MDQPADALVTKTKVLRYFTAGFRAVLQALQYSARILGVECVHARILGKCGETGNGQPVISAVTVTILEVRIGV